jgi:rubrerythrin
MGAGITVPGMETSAMKQHDKKFTISIYFEVCAKIEGLCAELYHYYSAVYQDNEEVSQLWKKTAQEEENHQKQFELAYRLRDEVDFELEENLDHANKIRLKLKNLLDHVHQNPPDIVTALTRAIEMEERLACLHMENAVRFKDKMVQKLFQALQDYDQDHVKALQHCLSHLTLHKSEMVG